MYLTATDLQITWIKQNLDNIPSKFILSWLEISVTGTLSIIRQLKSKFELAIILISDFFTQWQVTLRNKQKNSSNQNIVKIYYVTNKKNTTYNLQKSTREAINDIRNDVAIYTSTFSTPDLAIKAISDYADKKHTTTWPKALSTVTNAYSFVIRYFNNTLANNTNLS